jgi:3-hydroxyisobutyrate dehydrogenase-like beta-hydroxyacid dehydrogenase
MPTMTTHHIAILHPGQMGISIAANLQQSGHLVHWLPAGRSPQTFQRAEQHSLIPAESLETLVRDCSVIFSICPPDAATEVASHIASAGFSGDYVDANAISPQHSREIDALLTQANIRYIDGGIIGGPAWEPGTTLYLSGRTAADIAALFTSGPLGVQIIGDQIGKASALKMCYAAYSKGTTALLAAVLAAADELGVRPELEMQWSGEDADFATVAQQRTRRVTAKAWRFAGEMEEIAATFEAAGLPPGFHLAARQVFQRLAQFKDRGETPSVEEVLIALRK